MVGDLCETEEAAEICSDGQNAIMHSAQLYSPDFDTPPIGLQSALELSYLL